MKKSTRYDFEDNSQEYPIEKNPLPLTGQWIAEKYLEVRRMEKEGTLTPDKRVVTFPRILCDL